MMIRVCKLDKLILYVLHLLYGPVDLPPLYLGLTIFVVVVVIAFIQCISYLHFESRIAFLKTSTASEVVNGFIHM